AFRRSPVRAEVWGHTFDLQTGSGVFAVGRVDVGTAALFREVDPPTGVGTVLDPQVMGGVDDERLHVVTFQRTEIMPPST
ncbi:hypothetical protein, partial [Raoultella terrigena]|uniref:hypothetical protein n=1 Tax=Raoultella terrigena TaxID=577 RepID=UPI001C706F53